MSDLATHLSMIQPPTSLLVKLGSIAVHADEFLGPDRHEYDAIAIQQLLKDPEVLAWMKEMDAAAMLPKKRNNPKVVKAKKR